MLLPFVLCAKKTPNPQKTQQTKKTAKKPQRKNPNQKTTLNYFFLFSLACNESIFQIERRSLKPSKHCDLTKMDTEQRRKTNRPKGHEIIFDTLSDT